MGLESNRNTKKLGTTVTFELESVIPWGRRFREYQAMFRLTSDDLQGRILGCGDGPASFNAEATVAGSSVVSVDPLYAFPVKQIESRIAAVFEDVMAQVSANASDFVWGEGVNDLSDLRAKRRAAMDDFLADFQDGQEHGRYVTGRLPFMPFDDDSFDLAVCSHFLFLYSEQLSTEIHVESVIELCRVAKEVRVFPLLENGNHPSRHLVATQTRLRDHGIKTKIETVDYEFQRGGNQMLLATTEN